MNKYLLKTELIIVLFGIVLNILIAQNNLEKFDKTIKDYEVIIICDNNERNLDIIVDFLNLVLGKGIETDIFCN